MKYIKYRDFTDILKNFHYQIFLRCQKNVTFNMCTRKKHDGFILETVRTIQLCLRVFFN